MPPKKVAKNKPKPTQKIPKQKGLKVYYPEQLNVIYTNHTNFVMSDTDLTIDLGVRSNRVVNNQLESDVHVNARVIMSPQHAKAFITKMGEVIGSFEKDFGIIQTKPKSKNE